MSIATLTVQDVAERVGGTVEGDPAAVVRDVKPIAEAGAGEITFLANAKYQNDFGRSQATCVVVPVGAALPAPGPGRAWIRHLEPYVAFAKLVAIFRPSPPVAPPGVHPGAHVAADAVLGADVSVGAGAVIESGAVLGDRVVVGPLAYVGHGVRLGEGTKLYPRAVVYYGCVIGKRCILHAGSVIGADGFGYAMDMEGRHQKIPQAGNVILEDDVEVGANAAIDRAVLGSTKIGAGSKIDNLVQVAHNVEVGAGSILIAQCGISGSTKLGQYVVIAAQAGIVGHIEIGDLAQVGAQAGVSKSIPPGMKVMGAPAVEAREGLRAYALIDRLPELKKRIADVEKRLTKVEGSRS